MSKMVFKLNLAGVRRLMKSQAMMGICKNYAGRAVERLGDGYEADSYVGVNRVNASVKAVSYKARKENAESNTILKAVK